MFDEVHNEEDEANALAREISGPSARVRSVLHPGNLWSVSAYRWKGRWDGGLQGPTGYGDTEEEALTAYRRMAQTIMTRHPTAPTPYETGTLDRELQILRDLLGKLPKCQCGRVAIGYYTTNQRVIGRKMYGRTPIPSCGICPPVEGSHSITRYPYSGAAGDYNAHRHEIGEDPTIPVSVDTPAVQG